LASALNHSAERVQTLRFSFLTFMLYLAIATGTTTHRMLFLERGIAAQWQATGCASEGAPYVLRALLGRLDGDAAFCQGKPGEGETRRCIP
jgi:hypothetical protein